MRRSDSTSGDQPRLSAPTAVKRWRRSYRYATVYAILTALRGALERGSGRHALGRASGIAVGVLGGEGDLSGSIACEQKGMRSIAHHATGLTPGATWHACFRQWIAEAEGRACEISPLDMDAMAM